MSTSFTFGDQTVATRFFNGTCAAVQLELTETEFAEFEAVEVDGDDGSRLTLCELVESVGEVRFDSAARQNALARDFENNCFAGVVDGFWDAANDCRRRACDVSRQTFVTV